jgi:hypothetical protein
MIITRNEKFSSNFKGTIIDLETIGDFSRQFADNDSKQYQNLKPTILGYITKNELTISCAKGNDAIDELIERGVELIPSLEKPLFAFQSRFERGVFHHSFGVKIAFDGELNRETFERKGNACTELGIPNYGDPFNHDGRLCYLAWAKGDYENAIKHNRNCLLSERDILLKRGCRTPDILEFR